MKQQRKNYAKSGQNKQNSSDGSLVACEIKTDKEQIKQNARGGELSNNSKFQLDKSDYQLAQGIAKNYYIDNPVGVAESWFYAFKVLINKKGFRIVKNID